jgi:hypothetical protein
MIDDARGGPLTLQTVSRTYVRRRAEHKASGGEALGIQLWFVDALIAVGFINAEGTDAPTEDHVRIFYEEERLADYVLENPRPRSLTGLVWRAVKMQWYALVGA